MVWDEKLICIHSWNGDFFSLIFSLNSQFHSLAVPSIFRSFPFHQYKTEWLLFIENFSGFNRVECAYHLYTHFQCDDLWMCRLRHMHFGLISVSIQIGCADPTNLSNLCLGSALFFQSSEQELENCSKIWKNQHIKITTTSKMNIE